MSTDTPSPDADAAPPPTEEPAATGPCCRVGKHPDLAAIDADLRGGQAVRKVADRFGFSKSSIGEHRKTCLGLPPPVRQLRGHEETLDSPADTDAGTAGPIRALSGGQQTKVGPQNSDVRRAIRPRAPNDDTPTSPPKLLHVDLERACVDLRASGRPYSYIALKLGIDRGRAVDLVEHVLLRTIKGTNAKADSCRALDLERIDQLLAALWTRAMRPPPEADAEDGKSTPAATAGDFKDQDRAVERITKLMERRAKLLGLDAPTVTISLEHPKVRAELERAFLELYELLAETLRPHPEALRAVMLAMRTWRSKTGVGAPTVDADVVGEATEPEAAE